MVDINKPERMPKIEQTSRLASSIGFSVTRGKRPTFSVLTNFDSIRDNIRNILFFRKGDYLDDPDFGIGFQDYLFEQGDEFLRTALDQEIRRQIRKYESRARITNLQIYRPSWLENGKAIDMSIEIAGLLFRGVGSTGADFSLYSLENRT